MTSSVLRAPDWHTAPAYEVTFGPEVADLCEMVGYAPYPEQRLILNDVFALTPGGKRSAAFETDIVIARQQLKTGVLKQMALGWLFLTGQRLVVWSAHEFATAREAFRDMRTIIDGSDVLRPLVEKVTTAAGAEAIELRSGARLVFKARTKVGGRGLTGWKVILDEAFALQPEHTGALVPTLIKVPDPQLVLASSAGMQSSAVLRDARDRGRAGVDPHQVYVEWTSPRQACGLRSCQHEKGTAGCALDDRGLWAQACPVSFRDDPSLAIIAKMRSSMPVDEFMRECLGWWDDPADDSGSPIPAEAWRLCADVSQPVEGRVSFGLALSEDQAWSAIAVAGVRADGRRQVELVANEPGTGWVVDRLVELTGRWDSFGVALDPASAAGALLTQLGERGVPVTEVSGRGLAQACGELLNGVVDGVVCHRDDPALNMAVRLARTRPASEAWVFSQRSSTSDISPLMAATQALHLLAVNAPARYDPLMSVW